MVVSSDLDLMISRAFQRMDDRFLSDARRSAIQWQPALMGLKDAALAGLDVAIEIELERRGMLDRAPGGRART